MTESAKSQPVRQRYRSQQQQTDSYAHLAGSKERKCLFWIANISVLQWRVDQNVLCIAQIVSTNKKR